MTPAHTVALSLGSNLGDRRHHLEWALEQVGKILSGCRVAPLSETTPVSPQPQPSYLNTAVVGESVLEPVDLLALLKRLEHAAGRRTGPRWGSRPLDIDLLVAGNRMIDLPELTLPHPRLRQRRFYLEPLAAIAPDLAVPPDGATIGQLLAALPPQD